MQALRQKGEILSKNLDDLTFTDIKKIYEIEYEIKRHESNPEADLHKHFEIDISDEEISLWPGCISSILAPVQKLTNNPGIPGKIVELEKSRYQKQGVHVSVFGYDEERRSQIRSRLSSQRAQSLSER